jgi:hypothetical protein
LKEVRSKLLGDRDDGNLSGTVIWRKITVSPTIRSIS